MTSLGRLPDEFLVELRSRVPIQSVVSRRVKLVRSGKNWKACCPFHDERTPSFQIYDDGYHCFGCGAHGDVISFVMAAQGLGFMDAVRQLAGEAGLEVPTASPAATAAEQRRMDLRGVLDAATDFYRLALRRPGGAPATAYLRARGLTHETIEKFGLGWSGDGRGGLVQYLTSIGASAGLAREAGLLRDGEDGAPGGELFFNRVMFPIRDARGRTISFGGRTLGDGQPKYVNGPETPLFSKRRALYGLDLAAAAIKAGGRSPPNLLMVEGYLDVISLHQAGFSGAVAPLGTALTPDQVQAAWDVDPNPVLCFDGDAAGARASARSAEVILPILTPARSVRIATLPAGEDPDSLVRGEGGSARLGGVIAQSLPLWEALFGLLGAGAPVATPEDRAAFRARLNAAADTIQDRALAGEYRRALNDRYFESLRGRRGAPTQAEPREAPRGDVAENERVRTVLAVLINHPALYCQVEDQLQIAPLPEFAARMIDAIRDFVDFAGDPTREALIDHLDGAGRGSDVAWVLGSAPFPLPACALPGADQDAALAGLRGVLGMASISNIRTEINVARKAFGLDPTEANQRRLVGLCESLIAWQDA